MHVLERTGRVDWVIVVAHGQEQTAGLAVPELVRGKERCLIVAYPVRTLAGRTSAPFVSYNF
jgi:hypothetical protein